jgi:hypothetical protein
VRSSFSRRTITCRLHRIGSDARSLDDDGPRPSPGRPSSHAHVSSPASPTNISGDTRLNAELTNVCDILARTTPPPAKQGRFHQGFSWNPDGGHKLGLPGVSLAIELEQATHARLTIRGASVLCFAIDITLQDGESGEWGTVHEVLYVPHKDVAHNAAMSDLVVTHLLPPTALSIEIAAVDANGGIMARRKATIPRELLVDINRRVARAQNTSFRIWAADQAIAMLKLRRETSGEIKSAIIELIAPE